MPKKSKTHTRHEQFEGGEKLNFGQIVRKMSTLKKKSKHYKAKDLWMRLICCNKKTKVGGTKNFSSMNYHYAIELDMMNKERDVLNIITSLNLI